MIPASDYFSNSNNFEPSSSLSGSDDSYAFSATGEVDAYAYDYMGENMYNNGKAPATTGSVSGFGYGYGQGTYEEYFEGQLPISPELSVY